MSPVLDELTDGNLVKRYRILRHIKRIDDTYVPESEEETVDDDEEDDD